MTPREQLFTLAAAIGLAIGGLSLWEVEEPHTPATIATLRALEGFNGDCYPDAGGQSVGYGTHLPLTKAEGELLLAHRLGETERGLAARWKPYQDQPEHVKQALSLMAYQLGVEGELQFKRMLGCLEQDDTHCAAREALDSKWHRQTPGRAEYVAALLRLDR